MSKKRGKLRDLWPRFVHRRLVLVRKRPRPLGRFWKKRYLKSLFFIPIRYYPIIAAGALNSLFFGVYGVSLRFMTSLRAPEAGASSKTTSTWLKPNNWEIFWAGCAGGAAQLVVACPVDVAKIKLQTQTGKHNSFYLLIW